MKNAKELVDEFKGRMKVKVRQQKRIGKMWRVEMNLNTKELNVRYGSHQEIKVCGIGLVMQTSRMILALAYVLCHLSAI